MIHDSSAAKPERLADAIGQYTARRTKIELDFNPYRQLSLSNSTSACSSNTKWRLRYCLRTIHVQSVVGFRKSRESGTLLPCAAARQYSLPVCSTLECSPCLFRSRDREHTSEGRLSVYVLSSSTALDNRCRLKSNCMTPESPIRLPGISFRVRLDLQHNAVHCTPAVFFVDLVIEGLQGPIMNTIIHTKASTNRVAAY
jgi:hypothetical protein